MALKRWLSRFTSGRRSSAGQRWARLPVEALEDRLAPAVFLVDRLSSLVSDGNVATSRGSLAWCISQANSTQGADTIQFDSSVFGPGGASGVSLQTALPQISDDLTIDGLSSVRLAIQRDSSAGSFGLLGIAEYATVVLNNLEFSNGQGFDGGALYNLGNLTLNDCLLDNNTAQTSDGGGRGGGIYNLGTLALHHCTIENNTSTAFGLQGGGGIYNAGSLTIDACLIAGNHATNGGVGGGIHNVGTLTITNTTLRANSADFAGGGIRNDQGSVSITASTLSGNLASFSAGISNNNGHLDATNTTFFGNAASGSGLVTAGGLGNYTFNDLGAASVVLVNCTFAGNSAAGTGNAGDLASVQQSGNTAPSITLTNTILASSLTSGQPNAATSGGSIVSLGHNVSSDNSFSPCTGDQLDTNPLLGSLRSNGGPVETCALLPGSPALDAGLAAQCVTTDARGKPRNGTVDVGAFESQGYSFQLTGVDQSTRVGTSFASPVRLRILEDGSNPIEGAQVRFTILAGSASASFPEGATTSNQFSDSDGFATSPVLTAGPTTGSFTVQASVGGQQFAGTLFVTANAPPQVNAGSDQFIDQGQLFTRTISFSDLDSSTFTGSVDYGDGTPVQALVFGPNQTAMLSHTFNDEGSFVVTVRITDGEGATGIGSFFADVMLPGVQVAEKGTGDRVSVPGATGQLFRAPGSTGYAALILAVVPFPVANSVSPPAGGPGNFAGAFDLRAVGNIGAGDSALVTFQYQSTSNAPPVILFFDRDTGKQQVVTSPIYRVDLANHTITILFNQFSTPRLQEMRRTVFTISVPTEIPAGPPPGPTITALALATTAPQSNSTSSGAPTGLQLAGFRPPTTIAAGTGSGGGADAQGQAGGQANIDTGPLHDLPPTSDAVIGLPSATVVPSQLNPTKPPDAPVPPPPRKDGPGKESPTDSDVPPEPEANPEEETAADEPGPGAELFTASWLRENGAAALWLAPLLAGWGAWQPAGSRGRREDEAA